VKCNEHCRLVVLNSHAMIHSELFARKRIITIPMTGREEFDQTDLELLHDSI
jgi:hypothetical protein